MATRRHRSLYFAYGSNMCRIRLERRIGAVDVVGAAVLTGFRHRFNKLGADGTAKGNIVAVGGARVVGVVYAVSEPQLETLDVHEGGYRRLVVSPARAGALVEAVAFVAVAPVVELAPPSSEYLEFYRRGLEQHGIDSAYLAELIEELS